MIVDHLPHIEDLRASELYNFLQKPITQSLKFDGAPSIVIGNGWVALKSSWKTKRYLNRLDVHNSGLSTRVQSIFFDVLEKMELDQLIVGKNVVIQADVLAHDTMCLDRTLFHPNTLIYDFDYEEELVLVVHSVNVEEGDVPWVCLDSDRYRANLINPTHNVSLVDHLLDELALIERYDVDPNAMKAIIRYRNFATKEGLPIYRLEKSTLLKFVEGLIINERKSILNPGRVGYESEYRALRDYIELVDFDKLYEYTMAVLAYKTSILSVYYQSDFVKDLKIKTYVESHNGTLLPTSHEGMVLKNGDSAVKLVDRHVFSTYNFSKNIKKGFDR